MWVSSEIFASRWSKIIFIIFFWRWQVSVITSTESFKRTVNSSIPRSWISDVCFFITEISNFRDNSIRRSCCHVLGWLCTEYGLDTGFIDHLYTPLGTSGNYGAIADLHTSQFTVTHTSVERILFLWGKFLAHYSFPWGEDFGDDQECFRWCEAHVINHVSG
jgi:hypothetical protein